MSALMKVFDIGDLVSPGEQLHVNLLHRCKDMRDDVTMERIKGDREFLTTCQDLLTETLQWMDEHDV